jgi:hypothetical protein
MANELKQKLINAHVYEDNARVLGIANVTLPNLEPLTDGLKGLGIAGEMDVPILGHFGSMTCQLDFTVVQGDISTLSEPRSHQLVVRAAIQVQDTGLGTYSSKPLAVYMTAVPKGTNLGKLEPGAGMDTQLTFEVTALKLFVDNKEAIEVDKLNMIYRVNGVDYLAGVRTDMGL